MSYTHKAAKYCTKEEHGLSQAMIGDVRQIFAIIKKQHGQSRKGHPSLLRGLMKEAHREEQIRKANHKRKVERDGR